MNGRKLIQVKDVMKTQFDIVDGMITVAEALQKMERMTVSDEEVEKFVEGSER